MNTTVMMDELERKKFIEKPGAKLLTARQQKGYSVGYVAGKLHLRLRLIELLEADEYHLMPEPVFIRGYLRAYAKLLDVPADPLLEAFNALNIDENNKFEKAVWQHRRETPKAEHAIRWITVFFAVGVLVAVTVWWHKNKGNERLFSSHISQKDNSPNTAEHDIRLTDLSKMRSLLSSVNLYPEQHPYSKMESDGE